jgi:galactokinase
MPISCDTPLKCFSDLTGAAATHMVYAPGRVNLIGEHTDYNDGFVLPLAIDLGVALTARKRDDSLVRIWSAGRSEQPVEIDLRQAITPGEPAWSNYVRGVLAGLQNAGLQLPGFDAVIYANLPAGGGLSSSAALEIATATLGEMLSGTTLDPVQKALLCQKAEHEFAGTPCGIMDQFAVTFGKAGHLLLLDCQSQQFELVPMPQGEVSLLVINSMVKHDLSEGEYKKRRDDCHAAAAILGVATLRAVTTEQVVAAQAQLGEHLFRRAHHVTTENERTLAAVAALKAGDWDSLGKLMHASHASLRDDYNVSCPELDAIAAAAEAAGAYGCRMTGGGFGGCCVALVPTSSAQAMSEAIIRAYQEATGRTARVFGTLPSDGPQIILQPIC